MRLNRRRLQQKSSSPSPTPDDLLRELRKIQANQDRNFVRMQALAALYELLPLRNVLPLIPRQSGVASPVLLHRLVAEIISRRPHQSLECGSGVSTLIGGYAIEHLGAGGKWTALEHDPAWHRRVSDWVSDHGLGDTVEVLLAPLVQHELPPPRGERLDWYDLSALRLECAAELVLVDGPPGQRNSKARLPAAYLLQPYLRDGALALIDDCRRLGEREMVEAWAKDGLLTDVSTLADAKHVTLGTLRTSVDAE